MRAGDLAVAYPAVALDSLVIDAGRLLAGRNLAGLVVAQARVIDEGAADMFLSGLGERTVAECRPAQRRELAVVDSDGSVRGAVTLEALLDRVLPR